MHDVRQYLEERLTLEGDKGWTRREPRETHPEIVDAVRAFQATGGHYDDEAVRFVADKVGELPAPELRQLGHECFIAKGQLRDEENAGALERARGDGFALLEEIELEPGARYTVRAGTIYCGQSVPSFGAPRLVRGKQTPRGTVGFVLKGARNFVHIPTPTLVREGWDA